MEELKRSQSKFNTEETEKIIGSIVVDFSSVKKKVRSKYNAWHKEVMDKFAEITNEGMKQFISLINEARTNLEGNSLENEGKDIISFITEIQKFTENEKDWALEMEKFKNSKQILDSQKYRFRGEFTSMEQLESEWNKFEQILQKKQKEMDEKIPALVKQVEADKINLSQELKNLESFWAQNKPETADNPAAALKVLEKTSEKINSIKDAFIKNCTAAKLLKLESENPNRLDNITHEVEDFKNVWNSLNIIYSKIDAKKKHHF
jgi:dynein heavy chain 1